VFRVIDDLRQFRSSNPRGGPMPVQPYLMFNGRCEEAVEFYKRAVGAEVEMLLRYDDSPDPVPAGMIPPKWGRKVMHTTMRIAGAQVLASDGDSETPPTFRGFSLSITLPAPADVDRVFHALAEGGKVTMPPAKTFWSERFGMLTDRFGVGWMVMVEA
jgi:PhnB protein